MITLTLSEIADIVAGRVLDASPDQEVSGPAFLDTRSPEPGGLFVAFEGQRVDGHDYAAGAVAGGAAAVLGTRATGVPTVLVTDAQAALQQLAQVVLQRRREMTGDHPIQVVAITGSQGKTTAKDMLARVLADQAPTVATAGSFNNELGLPLTVLRITAETRYLVLEMGARGIGHLAELCRIAPPDSALVLNVGKAHLGEFGSQEQIAVAKGEIVEALDAATGTAVLNADDPLVAAMVHRTAAGAVSYGTANGSDVRLSEVSLDDLGRARFRLQAGAAGEQVQLRLLGEHQAINAAATAAAAWSLGVPLGPVARSLGSIERLSPWRMELHERSDGLVVVNDAYNANPDSMRAALHTLARMGGPRRRTVAVLGEMLELGADALEEHRELGRLAHRLGIDAVIVVGAGAHGIYEALLEAGGTRPETRRVETPAGASEWLRDNVAAGDAVLVKASRGGRLEQVAQMLIDGRSEPLAPETEESLR